VLELPEYNYLIGTEVFYSDNPLDIVKEVGNLRGLLCLWGQGPKFTLTDLDKKRRFDASYIRPVLENEKSVTLTKEEVAKRLEIQPTERLRMVLPEGGVV
jgi:hypothetical protein